MAITSFRGENEFLSNFYNWPFEFDGRRYMNAEAAFQAQKCPTENGKAKYEMAPPNIAKRMGRQEKLPTDWEKRSIDVMRGVLKAKFTNPVLRKKLLNTENETLVEGNTWHDNKWGDCICNKCVMRPGRNLLGNMLMELRDEIRKEGTDE